jgi:hypothetical protein
MPQTGLLISIRLSKRGRLWLRFEMRRVAGAIAGGAL